MSESRHRMTGRYPARSAHGPATSGGALAVCRSRLVRAAVAGFILFLFAAACSTAGAQGTRAECEAAGGKWGRFGLRQRELCDLPAPDAGKVRAAVTRIKRHTKLPVVVGFGVRAAKQARALAESAEGVAVGSALVNAVKDSLDRKGKATSRTVKAVTALVVELAKGVRGAKKKTP